MCKKIYLPVLLLFFASVLFAQSIEELRVQQAEKKETLNTIKKEMSQLQSELNAINKQLNALEPWDLGAFGTLGINFSQFNSWLGSDNPDAYTSTIGFTGNAFANLEKEKYFWRNAANLNIAKTKLAVSEEQRDTAEYETTADVINLSSLFGYKVSSQFAISTLTEYRSTILTNFNNPGYLDLGIGATWTPINNLVVVFHPLNYNFVFAQEDVAFKSSLGCKIVADYSRKLPRGISWRSNLSAFISYENPNNLSNYTWVNGFSTNIWKGLGAGIELGIRGNRQEAYNVKLAKEDLDPDVFTIEDLDSNDNPLQTYWILGITYTL